MDYFYRGQRIFKQIELIVQLRCITFSNKFINHPAHPCLNQYYTDVTVYQFVRLYFIEFDTVICVRAGIDCRRVIPFPSPSPFHVFPSYSSELRSSIYQWHLVASNKELWILWYFYGEKCKCLLHKWKLKNIMENAKILFKIERNDKKIRRVDICSKLKKIM